MHVLHCKCMVKIFSSCQNGIFMAQRTNAWPTHPISGPHQTANLWFKCQIMANCQFMAKTPSSWPKQPIYGWKSYSWQKQITTFNFLNNKVCTEYENWVFPLTSLLQSIITDTSHGCHLLFSVIKIQGLPSQIVLKYRTGRICQNKASSLSHELPGQISYPVIYSNANPDQNQIKVRYFCPFSKCWS